MLTFHFMVLDLMKTLFRTGLKDNKDQLFEEDVTETAELSDSFELIQLAFLRGVAIDWGRAKMALEDLGARFKKMYGAAFRLGDSELSQYAYPESTVIGAQ